MFSYHHTVVPTQGMNRLLNSHPFIRGQSTNEKRGRKRRGVETEFVGNVPLSLDWEFRTKRSAAVTQCAVIVLPGVAGGDAVAMLATSRETTVRARQIRSHRKR